MFEKMKWDDSEYRLLTEKIIKAFYNVHNKLGPGFLEKAYHNALLVEFAKMGLHADSEKQFPVKYDDTIVADYVPDIVVEDKIIVETKTVKALDDNNKAQLISQLRSCGILIGFLANFALAKMDFKRIDNYYELKKRGLWKEDTLI